MTLLDFAATTEGRGLMSDDATLMPNLQALHDYVAGLHRAFTLDELCDHLEAAGATPLETVEAVEAWVAETEGAPDARLVVALLDLPNDPWHLTADQLQRVVDHHGQVLSRFTEVLEQQGRAQAALFDGLPRDTTVGQAADAHGRMGEALELERLLKLSQVLDCELKSINAYMEPLERAMGGEV
jgi:DNA-binding Xre family transcriptional regulator